MKKIIGADSANKLAGLQIDSLSKYRAGQLTLEHWEWWNNLSGHQRDVLMRGGVFQPNEVEVVVEPKFALLVDLGIIRVPNDYVHACRLATFHEQNCEKFRTYNDNISDENFQGPSRILHPGDRLHVHVFQQVVTGTTTTKERMEFLATQKAIHTGAQGLSLVFEQKCDQLPKDKWCISFDEANRLWEYIEGKQGVPYVSVVSENGFDWDLGNFKGVWYDWHAFLCFTEVED